MSKKLISIFVLTIFVLATVLAGCSSSKNNTSSANETNTQKQETAKPVTIKLGMWSSSPAEKKIVDDQIAKFKEKYPNIDVQIETIVGDYMQKLQTELASNTAPDIFYLDSMPAPQLMSSGVLEPLDDYIKKYNVDVNDFEPALLSAFQWDGKTYGLPKDFNTLALFYNKDMFKAAGINEPPKTWEELRDVAKKLTKDGVKGLVLSADLARFDAFINQNGGSVYQDGKVTLNLPENAQALDFYVSLITKDKVADTPQNMGEGWNGDAFAAKKAAMAIEGGWMIPFLKEKAPDLNYGIAELPAGKQKSTMAFTVAYVMNKNSKHKDEAFKLIEFLTGKEGQQFVVDSGLALPSRKSMQEGFKEKYPERAAFVDGASYAVPWQFGLYGTKVVDAANKACEALIMKQISSAQQALDNAQKEVGQ
ncbi:ABC transporter substrate-binding protein [Thermoanaerobacter brockii subsp. lactiethylicus]|jgi:multiple sugar transport system substrate-binding protein|uniref:Extracellular solute-binding protein, family 1 n=2 Tax=Thermoanaerobacter TaxID=1754 RepID=B0KAN3_THEP3|nr:MULTISPECIES: ABC transporter substrate-binding protein [Thermoanaerobacter]ABY93473.1 extracellular solute-binding protein, family 1 [Thermoanaerobacter sp. X514]ABY95167.1 extracellular solute-binding protein, family 1 [Thermoanaerobacter pseudethanolicus ATCC 33223]ADV80116.1 extracellular solute-binding protein family 1 [Thermoanaerobacter brockii subsp. finnii Ako-1]MDI3529758.1 multiple sugar transport system substrate-binding protein [Thermoanaerobacter sp.]HBW60617.1 ABC transporter